MPRLAVEIDLTYLPMADRQRRSRESTIETSPGHPGEVDPARPMVVSESVTQEFGCLETDVPAFEDLCGGSSTRPLIASTRATSSM